MMKKDEKPYTLKRHREEVLEKMSKKELVEYSKTKVDEGVPII